MDTKKNNGLFKSYIVTESQYVGWDDTGDKPSAHLTCFAAHCATYEKAKKRLAEMVAEIAELAVDDEHPDMKDATKRRRATKITKDVLASGSNDIWMFDGEQRSAKWAIVGI